MGRIVQDKLDLATISKRVVRGALSLTFRRVALQAISFITINLVLARILSVSTLGVFNIGTAIISFFVFFADIGLAAALIQKKESITTEDLKTTFTIQQILVVSLAVATWLTAPFLAQLYGLDNSGVWLIRALSLSFAVTSFKVIPSIILERELKFSPLVWVEILETLVFNIGLIVLVLYGFGLTAFSISAVARALIGAVAIYIIAPWKIGLGISYLSAQGLLKFGVPYQLNSILALLKDRLVPLVIARMVGPLGIGYITWAQNLAFLPLEVMNIVIRVSFPALSRLQEDKKALKSTLEKSLFLTTLFLYPMLFGMLALAPSLVEHVVSSKWAQALPAFYLFSISTFWATLSTTFTNTLNAIGQIRTTLKLMIFWTLLTWILTPVLTYYFGFIGVAISSSLISLTSVITIILIKRFVNVAILENIWSPLLASIAMGGCLFYLSSMFVKDLTSLIIMIAIGGIIYWSLIMVLAKAKLKDVLGEIKYAFSSK